MDFSLRLLAAFAILSGLILAQGLLNVRIASEAEHQVVRGRVAGDILAGLLELSATKQRLRAWSLRALIGADHAPDDGEMLRSRMAAKIERLQELSRQSRIDDKRAGASTSDDDARDEALALIGGAVVALKPAIQRIIARSGTDDARSAWAEIETVFDEGAGRDLREVLNGTIATETVQLDVKRADADAALRELRHTSTAMSLVITLVGMAFAALAVGAIRRPLREMSQGALAYEGGRLDHRMPVGRRDEFGRFAESINRMAAELAQRRDEEADRRLELERLIRQRTADLETALEKLRESEARRRLLLGDISHELRTPTTAIRGEAEIALRGRKEAEDYRGALTRISQAAGQMGGLIDDLLMMARGGDDVLSLNKDVIDVSGPLEEALLSAASAASQRSVELASDVEDAEVLVHGDATRLRQVMALLLDNAIRYSNAQGTVRISARRAGGTWRFEVRDEGIGIPPEDLPFVFDRTFRAGNARTHRPEGTGLGLSIAKRLAEAHGGRIELESATGGGTVARLTLPLHEPERAAGMAEAAS